MDDKTLADLNAHAEAVATRLGIHAGVSLSEAEKSDVNPGGTRVVLTIYRNPSGSPRRTDFAPTARDLKARIEQEISVLAKDL
jgi:hypothetical protein